VSLRILIADPDPVVRRDVSLALRRHDVVEVADDAAARDALRGRAFDLVVTSLVLGEACGLDLSEQAPARSPESKPVLLALVDRGDDASAVRALRAGAHDCLVRSCHEVLLESVLRRAIRLVEMRSENRELLKSLKKHVELFVAQSRRLERMAVRDEMTGLYNHRYFRESLGREVARARRYARPLSLVFADVDSFKSYNDTQGHLAGDALLAALGGLIARDSRESTLVARYGGEEFVLLAPETDHAGAVVYAEKLRALVESHTFEGGETRSGGRITMSFGVATLPDHATDGETLIQRADEALYRAKRSGRNRVCGFAPAAAESSSQTA
jgi:diguanylate cyclase (GGDEF)-like protein